MQVLVTRPAAQAPAWVDTLRSAGLDAQALPLMEVAGTQPEALAPCWARLLQGSAASAGTQADGVSGYDAVMFVSANAIDHFFAARPQGGAPKSRQDLPGLRYWVTGPGSRKALLAHGVQALCIDGPSAGSAQWDSEALWAQVGPGVRPSSRVLIVRGTAQEGAAAPNEPNGVGRDWFAQQVQAAGGQVDFCVAYVRRVPQWTDAQYALAQRCSQEAVWLFSSSEAVANLCTLLPRQSWSQARCVATHARIADVARAAGFGVVCLSRPAPDALLASIKSLA